MMPEPDTDQSSTVTWEVVVSPESRTVRVTVSIRASQLVYWLCLALLGLT